MYHYCVVRIKYPRLAVVLHWLNFSSTLSDRSPVEAYQHQGCINIQKQDNFLAV
ncbi:unnamed protein product [Ixodes pacificus]